MADEALWDHVYDSFRRQYADMQERERAEDTLQQGISMKQGDLDAYIAEYEVLVEMRNGRVRSQQLAYTKDLY